MTTGLFLTLLSLIVGVLGTAYAVKESKRGQIALFGILLGSGTLYLAYHIGTLSNNPPPNSVENSVVKALVDGNSPSSSHSQEELGQTVQVEQDRLGDADRLGHSDRTNYSGQWELQVIKHHELSPAGQRRPRSGTYEIMIRLDHHGNVVTGEYLWASDGACPRALISGKMSGTQFEGTVTYHGACCGGLQMKLSGTLLTDNRLEGRFEPLTAPPSNCWAWWANVVGNRV